MGLQIVRNGPAPAFREIPGEDAVLHEGRFLHPRRRPIAGDHAVHAVTLGSDVVAYQAVTHRRSALEVEDPRTGAPTT